MVVIFPVVFIASVSISIIYFAYLIARSIVFIICINYIIIVGTFVYAATVFIILICGVSYNGLVSVCVIVVFFFTNEISVFVIIVFFKINGIFRVVGFVVVHQIFLFSHADKLAAFLLGLFVLFFLPGGIFRIACVAGNIVFVVAFLSAAGGKQHKQRQRRR